MESSVDHKQNELDRKFELLEHHGKQFSESFNTTQKIISVTELFADKFEDAFIDFYLTFQKYQGTHNKVMWQGELEYINVIITQYHMMFGNIQKSTGHKFKKLAF